MGICTLKMGNFRVYLGWSGSTAIHSSHAVDWPNQVVVSNHRASPVQHSQSAPHRESRACQNSELTENWPKNDQYIDLPRSRFHFSITCMSPDDDFLLLYDWWGSMHHMLSLNAKSEHKPLQRICFFASMATVETKRHLLLGRALIFLQRWAQMTEGLQSIRTCMHMRTWIHIFSRMVPLATA